MPRKPKIVYIEIPYPACIDTVLGTTQAPTNSVRRVFKVCCENLYPPKLQFMIKMGENSQRQRSNHEIFVAVLGQTSTVNISVLAEADLWKRALKGNLKEISRRIKKNAFRKYKKKKCCKVFTFYINTKQVERRRKKYR